MITKIPENSSVGTHIDVPKAGNVPSSPLSQQPTPYDYLVLLPLLITAVTPLILGLRKKPCNKDES